MYIPLSSITCTKCNKLTNNALANLIPIPVYAGRASTPDNGPNNVLVNFVLVDVLLVMVTRIKHPIPRRICSRLALDVPFKHPGFLERLSNALPSTRVESATGYS